MRTLWSWLRAVRHLPEMTRIRVVDVEANDIVFILLDEHISAEGAARMKEQFERITGLPKSVIIAGVSDIGVIRDSDALAGS